MNSGRKENTSGGEVRRKYSLRWHDKFWLVCRT
jgi:hypothetical protein